MEDCELEINCRSNFRYYRRARPDGKAALEKVIGIDEPITLSIEQLDVLKAISAGESVFVTGSAGTGKSFVIEKGIKILKLMYNMHDEDVTYRGNHVFVTASTGLAACAINGTTLHSFAGIGLGIGTKETLLASLNKERRKRWINTDVLVIDEISMIDAELFDKVEFIARKLKDPSKPFGGIQLLVAGDFFQLPPVKRSGENKTFAFNSSRWNECFDLQMELTHVFRQADTEFVGMLNELRRGICTPETHRKLLRAGTCVPSTDTGIIPTLLYPLRRDVDRENEQRLEELKKTIVTFVARDTGKIEALEKGRPEKMIMLAVGAQVMLVKNLDQGLKLVNGSRGVVVGFTTQVDKNVTVKISEGGGFPVVRFLSGMEKVITEESWSVMEGEVEVAARIQIPLILAWASTIHKCQGMTLDCIQSDLSASFEDGMVYVALSRAKTLEGLYVTGFNPYAVRAHPQVVEFYEQLKRKRVQGMLCFYGVLILMFGTVFAGVV